MSTSWLKAKKAKSVLHYDRSGAAIASTSTQGTICSGKRPITKALIRY